MPNAPTPHLDAAVPVLDPPPHTSLRTPPITPPLRVERFVAAALTLNDVTEQGGENRGQTVEWILRSAGLAPGEPWCAAYIYHVGYWSQYNPATQSSSWPLPRTGACTLLGDFARAHDVLSRRPSRGDVFLLYFPSLNRFAHTGIILTVTETPTAYQCLTIEGNTNDDGSREGYKSCIKTRTFEKTSPHRFIQWEAAA
ncbi:MAG TPA: hypothetical protein VNU46_01590 [Gemmatimonadaceae bacterium]|nr:hypothetical protein [Gemmatimonadaceae bacterium]